MAAQDSTQHAKKTGTIWANIGKPLYQKLRNALLEVITIVFGITVSIWLNDISNHHRQQQEVKAFLIGLQSDLTGDIQEMKADRESYEYQKQAFQYLSNIKLGGSVQQDSLDKYANGYFNRTSFIQNNGRFEGFKSSGKMGLIEDKNLQNAIMDLYQEDIPSLLLSTNAYLSYKDKFFEFVIKNRKRTTDSTTNIAAILVYDEAYQISNSLRNTDEIVKRYTVCIDKMKQIISQIDKIYKK